MTDDQRQKNREKYGVPVSTRIDANDADFIIRKCEASGTNLSKYIRILIERSLRDDEQVSSLKRQIKEEKDDAKQIAARFIKEISGGKPDRVKELASIYNQISYEYRTSKGGLDF